MEACAADGVPVITQVVLFREKDAGKVGAEVQLVGAPVKVGVCVVTLPTVSTTVEGVNTNVGLAAALTVMLTVAVTDPALLLAVTV